MKNARQQKILELIESCEIDTQETLIGELKKLGYNVTQTTISRDIRQLGLIKAVTHKGTYKYVTPGSGVRGDNSIPVLNSAITDAVTKIVSAGNIVVVKTYSGMANAIAVCVDSLYHDEIVGSVAGDDTILLVVKDNEAAITLEAELLESFVKK